MRDLLLWYLAVLVLGAACLPFTTTVLRRLPDHGWSLTKPLAILLLGIACWLPPTVFPFLPYSRGWIVVVALLLVAGNVVYVLRRPERWTTIVGFVRRRWLYVGAIEAIFAGGLWLMGWLRTYGPKVENTEKFMDQAFVSAIMRAQHLPPPDPWYAGQPINYYYFGHFLVATLAKLLGTAPSVAFNTGIALTAGLAAVAIAGVAANLSAIILAARPRRPIDEAPSEDDEDDRRPEERLGWGVVFGALAAVMALVLGNLRSFALWWDKLPSPQLRSALDWLQHSASWQFFDWWAPSRAIPNGVITEFPNFSFLLADLHAHVLALPYAVLALGVALNLWRLPRKRGLAALGSGNERWATLICAGLCLGSLYLLNGWDLPTYLGIALLAIALHQWRAHDSVLSGELARDIGLLGGLLVALAIVPFLPFWLTFVSPGQGIGIVTGAPDHLAPVFSAAPNPPQSALPFRTAISDEIAIFGLFFFILGSWLLALAARRLALVLPVAAVQPAPASMLLAGDAGQMALTGGELPTATPVLVTGQRTPSTWFRAWLIVALLGGAMAIFTWLVPRLDGWTFLWMGATVVLAGWLILSTLAQRVETEIVFPLLLVIAGAGVIALCEIVYLRDVFVGYSPRMNTIFKFYFQAWIILSIAAAAALAWIARHIVDRLPQGLERWQPMAVAWRGVWGLGLALVILMGCVYPLGASYAIYLWQPHTSSSLVGLTPGNLPQSDIDAIAWLNANVSGSPVIVEANSASADYSPTYGRVSTFTGLPTIMGWQGHEDQWRLTWKRDPAHAADFAGRFGAIQTIYTSTNPEQVRQLIRQYHVAYIYVGALEQQTYQANLRLDVLSSLFPLVYQREGVMIFQASDSAAR